MSIRVTRKHRAFLRAYLRGRLVRSTLLLLTSVPRNRPDGNTQLAWAAFVIAARRRFAAATRADVIRWVADTRVRRGFGGPGARLLARPCETLVAAARTGTPVRGLTGWQRAHSMILLSHLVEDAQFTDAAFEAFLTEAHTMAERMAT